MTLVYFSNSLLCVSLDMVNIKIWNYCLNLFVISVGEALGLLLILWELSRGCINYIFFFKRPVIKRNKVDVFFSQRKILQKKMYLLDSVVVHLETKIKRNICTQIFHIQTFIHNCMYSKIDTHIHIVIYNTHICIYIYSSTYIYIKECWKRRSPSQKKYKMKFCSNVCRFLRRCGTLLIYIFFICVCVV